MLYEQPTSRHDIRARTFDLARRAVILCDALFQRGRTAPLIARQLLRAGTSVAANLEEAAAAQSRADFISKCSIATKEARETLYWFRLVGASFPDAAIAGDIAEAEQIVAILTTIVKNARARSAGPAAT